MSQKMPKRVTIADVAREANVSVQTVSRAINDKGEISQATKERILEIARQLGFRPSGIARSLVKQQTATIGVVVHDIANPFFSEIVRGVEETARLNGFSVFLCNTDEDQEQEAAALESLWSNQVEGVILCSSRLDDEILRTYLKDFESAVLINRELPYSPSGVATIIINDAMGAENVVDHLAAGNHQQIAFVAGPEQSYSSQQRLQGYRTGLKKHSLPFDPGAIRHCVPDTTGGMEAGALLLRAHPEVTALFCYNDLVAIGVMEACRQAGRRIPQDVAIVGFDDIPMARLITPPLTTVRVAKEEIGKRAMQLIVDMQAGLASPKNPIIFQPELIIRRSAP